MDAPSAAQTNQKRGLVEYWQLLRNRKWTLLLFALLGVGAAYLISYRQVPVFQARTTMELQEGNATASILGKDLGLDSNVNDAYVQTQIRILQSNTLRQRVLQRLKDNHGEDVSSTSPPPALRPLLPGITGTAHVRTEPAAAPSAADAKLAGATVTVRMLGTSRIIEILCDSSEPKMASAFANTLAREYMDSNLEARWGSAQRTSDWLNKQLQDLRVKLEQSETQLQNYTRGSGLILANEQGQDNVQQEKLRQLQAEYSRAEAERVSRQSVYEVAMNTSADTIPQVLDNGRLGALTTKLAELRREMAELSTALTAQHPRVLRIQAQINEVEATFRRERDAIVARIKNEFEQAARREKMLEDAYRKQMQAVSDSSTKAIYYGILKREVETNRRLYDELLQKVKEVGIGATLQASNVRVLDPAELPRAPYKPNYMNNLALGLASGLLLGCLFVFTQSYVNRSLNAPGEASYYLNVPELGVIPSSDAVQIQKKLPQGDEKNAAGLLPLKEGANGNWSPVNESVELVTWQDRPSVLAESYRSTLASILSAKGPKDRPRVILVTSVDRGEGKSTTVSNLGIALAEINQRVLLLDADLRKPHMHKIFNLPNAWGLSNLLRERISLADSPIEALVKPTEIEGLYVLPSGPGTVSIANLLYSNRMGELLERVREEFDTILIDTPPMLHLSDARVLGRLAEGAILVIRAGRTTRDAALAAKQRLVDDGINVLGTVLNDWNPKDKNKYGYYRYSYTNDDK
ncbi:MAG: polysaccharide biosynthesis tyrosine autokinase [Bryobacteraceae bacterium]